ncbi:MAG TPA: hypothetical protein V6C64_04950 [Microcoleaceae cyanobacterium]|jgi:hypothetical protein
MDSGSNPFLEGIYQFASEVEQVFTAFIDDFTEIVDAFVETSEELAELVKDTIVNEVEQQFNEFFEPLFEEFLGVSPVIEEQEREAEDSWAIDSSFDPFPETPAVCAGCRHYHGQVYNGTLLVCGMHPYGWEGDNCPDREPITFN